MKPTKRQTIDNSLFLYGGIVAFALTGFAILNLNNKNSLIALILFLPVSIYFIVRIFMSLYHRTQSFFNTGQKRHPYFGEFTFTAFFSQSEITFLLNLVLLALAISTIFFRISLNILK